MAGLIGLAVVRYYHPQEEGRAGTVRRTALPEPVPASLAPAVAGTPAEVRALMAAGAVVDAEMALLRLLRQSPYRREHRLVDLEYQLRYGQDAQVVESVRLWMLNFSAEAWASDVLPMLTQASDRLAADPVLWLSAFGVRQASEPLRLLNRRMEMLVANEDWAQVGSLLALEGEQMSYSWREMWQARLNWEIGAQAEATQLWAQVLQRAWERREAPTAQALETIMPEEARSSVVALLQPDVRESAAVWLAGQRAK